MKQSNNHIPNRLIKAYNQMLASIRDAFEETDNDTSDISLQHALESARERIVHLGEVTIDEAQEISDFVKRDINDAAEYLMETSAEFSDWLLLDIEVVERKVIDMFLSVADRTRVELEQLKNHQRQLNTYYSGEITGPGTLQCSQCNTPVTFATTSQIEVCTKCGNSSFRRAEIKHEVD